MRDMRHQISGIENTWIRTLGSLTCVHEWVFCKGTVGVENVGSFVDQMVVPGCFVEGKGGV